MIDTPLGEMVALADETALFLLEFRDRKNFDKQIARILQHNNAQILDQRVEVHNHIEQELSAYFKGKLHEFTVPIKLCGTLFQQSALKALQTIPYGETRSYTEQAEMLTEPTAVRAVAGANASNHLAIIIPCHRVIGKNSKLTGYAGGIERKEALLKIETTK